MKRSEEYEMALAAESALKKAFQKYEEIIAELSERGAPTESNLSLSIRDSLRNLSRKIEAYFEGNFTMGKLVDEFIFEYEVVSGELELEEEGSVQVKKLARRLLSSYEDFIGLAGGKKKLKLLAQEDLLAFERKSKGRAYLFWFIGLFGILGLHRFYLGRIGTGIGWLLSGGLLGFGAIYDLLALSKMVDEQNTYNQLRAAKLKQLTEGKSKQ
ncbi:MAG: TM2 domain-containing protein [Gracilimonas sp.]